MFSAHQGISCQVLILLTEGVRKLIRSLVTEEGKVSWACLSSVTQMLRDDLCRSVLYLDSWLKAHVGCGAGISAPVERQGKQKGECEHHQIPCWNMAITTGSLFWNQA